MAGTSSSVAGSPSTLTSISTYLDAGAVSVTSDTPNGSALGSRTTLCPPTETTPPSTPRINADATSDTSVGHSTSPDFFTSISGKRNNSAEDGGGAVGSLHAVNAAASATSVNRRTTVHRAMAASLV